MKKSNSILFFIIENNIYINIIVFFTFFALFILFKNINNVFSYCLLILGIFIPAISFFYKKYFLKKAYINRQNQDQEFIEKCIMKNNVINGKMNKCKVVSHNDMSVFFYDTKIKDHNITFKSDTFSFQQEYLNILIEYGSFSIYYDDNFDEYIFILNKITLKD